MKAALEAEGAALALCFRNAECHRRATLELTPEHFTNETNQNVWRAISQHDAPLDLTLVAQTMSDEGTLMRIGGKARLAALKFNAAEPARLQEYITTLHEARAHRRLEATLTRAQAYVTNAKDDLSIISTHVNDMLSDAIKDTSVTNEGYTISDVLTQAFVESYEAMQREDGMVGYRTYVRAIDEMIGGFEAGHVTTLMGEAAVGKSALALQATIGASRNVPVGFVSLEMTPADLGQRIQACVTRVNFGNIRSGRIQDVEERLSRVSDDLVAHSKGFWVAPPSVESWDECVAWFTHMYYAHGVRLFCLDNILSLDYGGKDEYEHITKVASGSQRLVKKLGIALVLLHHTNTDEKPTLRRQHGAKAISRHSSNVLALWRENPEETDVYLMELKGRNVGRSERLIRFIPHEQRFADLSS